MSLMYKINKVLLTTLVNYGIIVTLRCASKRAETWLSIKTLTFSPFIAIAVIQFVVRPKTKANIQCQKMKLKTVKAKLTEK